MSETQNPADTRKPSHLFFNPSFRTELNRLLSGALAAGLVGLLLGSIFLGTTLFLCGYSIWLINRIQRIALWLRAGGKSSLAPPTTGLTDDIVALVHREKKYSRKQKNRYRNTLGQFNSLASDLPDAIIVLNENGEIRWSNPAAALLLNIGAEKDRGQRIDNLIRLPDFSTFISTPPNGEELEMHSPIDSDRILAVRKVPNENRMTLLIAADITQSVKTREMRKAFVADVSHELRTPLTVIRGYIEMLLDDDTLPAPVKNQLLDVKTHSERMQSLVEDLLELSKLENNPLDDDEGVSVNVACVIHSIVSTLKRESAGHHFECCIDDRLSIRGSERELYSVCNNLLNNAVKYTAQGTTIRVSWERLGDQRACYTVEDDGAGIEARHLSRLSERFYRVDKGRSRDEGGTGLGLAIVKHAVQRHGGQFELDSTPGVGSVFRATFPAHRTEYVK